MSPLRVVLWSVTGSGARRYSGPSVMSRRLYEAFAAQPELNIAATLVHGEPTQPTLAEQPDQPFARIARVGTFEGGALNQLKMIRAGKRWLRAHDYDVLHALSGFAHATSVARESERLGRPAVVTPVSHQIDFADKPGWRGKLGLYERRRRLTRRDVSAVHCASRAMRAELLGYGFAPEKLPLIPFPVDTERHRPVDAARRSARRRELGWPDRPTLLFAGGLTFRKRPDLLADAALLLDHVQIAFVGPEHDKALCDSIRAKLASAGRADAAVWHGYAADPTPCFEASDFFALPSSNEGQAGALLEAMATGLPSLSTRVSGSEDVIDDGETGFLIDADARQIADVLARLMGDPALAERVGRAALARVEAECAAKVVARRMADLFFSLSRYSGRGSG